MNFADNSVTKTKQPIKIGGIYTFFFSDVIGKGATAFVYKGLRITDGRPVAIKAIDLTNDQNYITRALLQSQKKALKTISSNESTSSPHILKLHDIIYEDNFCYIVTEYCGSLNLKQYLAQKGKLEQEEAHQIFRKILIGYCSISNANIIHRDLKPANIMLVMREKDSNKNDDNSMQTFEPVIIDFGFCQIIRQKTTMTAYNVGSPTYMSPEAYSKTLYSQKSDIWALGVILYEMVSGKTLDHGMDIKNYFLKLKIRNFGHANLNLEQSSFSECKFSSVTIQLLQSSLMILPHERCSAHKLKYILDKNMINKMNSASGKAHIDVAKSHHIFPSSQKLLIQSKSRNALFTSQQKSYPQLKCSGILDESKSAKFLSNSTYQGQEKNTRITMNMPTNNNKFAIFNAKLTESRYKKKPVQQSEFCQFGNMRSRQEIRISQIGSDFNFKSLDNHKDKENRQTHNIHSQNYNHNHNIISLRTSLNIVPKFQRPVKLQLQQDQNEKLQLNYSYEQNEQNSYESNNHYNHYNHNNHNSAKNNILINPSLSLSLSLSLNQNPNPNNNFSSISQFAHQDQKKVNLRQTQNFTNEGYNRQSKYSVNVSDNTQKDYLLQFRKQLQPQFDHINPNNFNQNNLKNYPCDKNHAGMFQNEKKPFQVNNENQCNTQNLKVKVTPNAVSQNFNVNISQAGNNNNRENASNMNKNTCNIQKIIQYRQEGPKSTNYISAQQGQSSKFIYLRR